MAWLPMGAFGAGYMRHEGIDFLPPAVNDDRGNDTIVSHAHMWSADIVLTLYDAWILKNYGGANFRWVAWCPVDGDPLGPQHAQALRQAWRVVAMSRHGETRLQEAGFRPHYIPLGFEEHLYPDADKGRSFRREVLGISEDAFVFGSVGLNYRYPGRKGFESVIEAFSRFRQGKDDVYLYLHCSPIANQSLDLNTTCDVFGVGDTVRFARPYPMLLGYEPQAMRGMYNALDCFVLATHGEGFGAPIIEALACGLPVIGTDCTSLPELVKDGATGILVPPATRYLTPGYYFYYWPDVDGLVRAMEDMYERHELEDATGRYAEGVYHAARFPNLRQICRMSAEPYRWDGLYDAYWKPFLADCEREIAVRSVHQIESGEQRSAATLRLVDDSTVHKVDGPLANVRAEYELLVGLDHPNIIRPTGHHEEFGWFVMHLPRLHGSLDRTDVSAWTEEERQGLLQHVSQALNYLHAKGIAHRDVHPSNVLLDGKTPVLSDFGWGAPCPGPPCVDFEPWLVPDRSPANLAVNERGYHTVVAYVRGLSLEDARATGLPGVPYQAVDGVGERDCSLRWDVMRPEVRGKRVLDVGCNLGYFAARSLQEGATYAVGIDRDAVTVGAARRLHPRVDFRVGDLNDGALPNERFDVAFVLSVLQHVAQPAETLGAVRKIADVVYVEVPDRLMHLLPKEAETIGISDRKRVLAKL